MEKLIGIILMTLSCYHSMLADSSEIGDIYKKVADELISIRKQYPDTQPKVYAILDQVDKMHSAVKAGSQKHQQLEKNLQDKIAENSALKQELSTLRNDFATAKKTVEIAKNELVKKMEEQREKNQALANERKDLMSKITALEAVRDNKPAKKKIDKELTENDL